MFSPNSKLREKVVPVKAEDERSDKPSANGQTWAQRLKRVFAIDIEKCEKCGGKRSAARMKVIACIEEPEVIDRCVCATRSDRRS